jgi:hypothetical protein
MNEIKVVRGFNGFLQARIDLPLGIISHVLDEGFVEGDMCKVWFPEFSGISHIEYSVKSKDPIFSSDAINCGQ